MRTTLAQIRASRIPHILQLCPTDSRVRDFVNEAQQRLVNRGKWWGTYQRYQICTNDSCLTWPRQIAAIESIAVCDSPITMRNEWYEFLPNGPGLQTGTDGGLKLIDRGSAVTFNDITGTNSILRVYADSSSDAGKRILIQGYDTNGQWIRTLDAGSYVDGEYITLLSAGFAVSTNTFIAITGVIKDQTNKNVRVYEYDQTSTVERALAVYEPDEVSPVYRRSLVVGLPNVNSCEGSANGCNKKTVTVMAKLEFIPVKNDTDFLIIGNVPALKYACQAIKKEENNLFDEANKYMALAITELEKELQHYLGDSTTVQMKVENNQTFGAGFIENPIGGFYI